MTAVAVKGSSGDPMIFTQSEATAADRTWMVHMALSADGTDATGITLACTCSKDGAAFGAIAGAITEVSGGWYKVVFTAVDLSTLGAFAVHVTGTGCDTLNVVHQVVAFDLDTATADPSSTGVTAIQAGLATASGVSAVLTPTRTKTIALGTIAADGASSGFDCTGATAVTLSATGTFGSGTVTVQVCADPTVQSPVWVNASPSLTLTSNGSKIVVLPVRAVRWNMSGSTSPSVVCTAVVSY